MNASRFVRPALVAVLLFVVAVPGYSQGAAAAGQFQPQVGQPGKDVVWVPTPQALVDKMLDMAKVTPQDYVIDLGSGDGRTVITAAKRGAKAHGIEYNPDMVALSQKNAATEKVTDRATFAKADLFESDFSAANVVTLFLLPDINLRLRPKILDMKPGTRIVSNSFTMGEWTADETQTLQNNCTSWCTALLWIVPAKVDGTWKLPQGELKLTQTFQMLTGTLTAGGATTNVTGKMNGDQITFSAGNAQYAGRVTGNTIEGTSKSGTTSTPFRATK
jgi:hypothetical protein